MPWTIPCPKCQRVLTVPEEAIDLCVQCPACRCAFTVGRPSSAGPIVTSVAGQSPPAKMPAEDRRRQADDDVRDPPPRPRRFDDEDRDEPYSRGELDYLQRQLDHRGPIIMTLGVLSLALFCIFPVGIVLGGIAIAMANNDLGQMAARRMNAAGRGATQSGKTLAVVGVIISSLAMLFFCLSRFNNVRF